MGVATGCVCKEYIYFLILLIPTPLVSVLFCSNILLYNVKNMCSQQIIMKSTKVQTLNTI